MKQDGTSKIYSDAEYGVLGSLLIDPGLVAAEVFSRVQASDFIHGDCRAVFETVREMYGRDDRIDALTVLHEVGEGFRDFLSQLIRTTPTAYNFTAYIDLLLDWSKRHRVAEVAGRLNGLCAVGAPIDEIMSAAEQITETLASGTDKDTFTMADLQAAFFTRLERPRQYLDWGFDKLNQYIYAECGTENGSLIVIGARPSTGKTAFALNFALEMAKKRRVSFFSFETGAGGIAERIETAESGVDFGQIKRGDVDETAMTEFVRHKKRLCGLYFTMIRSSGLSVDAIRARARRNKAEVVIVDYLQLISESGSRKSEYEQITEISKALQKLARSGLCVIALSQLSRSDEGGIRALRGSGQIEQDADVVMILDRPNKDNLPQDMKDCWPNIAAAQREKLRVLSIAKNRDGRTGDVLMTFDGTHQRFKQNWPDFLELRGGGLPKQFKSKTVAKPQQKQMEMEGA